MKACFDEEIKNLLQVILSAFAYKAYSIEFLGEIEQEKNFYSSVFYFKKRIIGRYKFSHDLVIDYGMSEDEYYTYINRINDALIELYDAFVKNEQTAWEAIELSYKDSKLNVKFKYDWLKDEKTPIERRVIWEYETLGIKPNKKTNSANLLEKYLKEKGSAN